mmetsp:Transcript_18679/g.52162  ORF Transcript_18679/g.52162 Transcript_18679/m.52162 type:complete len:230 (+) Transcript_18679:118-807(+)
MLVARRPSRVIWAAKSRGFGNLRIERSKYSYSLLPEFIVAILPMKGTTLVMKVLATLDRNFSPSGRENSRMQTRLVSCLRSTLFISRKALALSGTLRMPNDIDILSIDPAATPSMGSVSTPAASMPRTLVRSWASPLTSLTMPSRPLPSTLATPRLSISPLGSNPITTGPAEVSAPRSRSRPPTSRETSAVPVAKSSTRSPFSNFKHSWTSVFRQNWSRPKDIHLLVES